MEDFLYPVVGAVVIALASFVAGGFYYKHFVSEAQAIKSHVSHEAEAIRAEVSAAVKGFVAKL